MSEIKTMAKFGGTSRDIKLLDFSTVTKSSQLPKEMQINFSDINLNTSLAAFICYGVKQGFSRQIIANRTGFSILEIDKVVVEAKEAGIFDDLVGEFLKE